jgi:hypothetical protein
MLDALRRLLARLFGRPVTEPDAEYVAPSTRFSLDGWKLQIPGPRDIRALGGYGSRYFSRDASKHMRFWVDCAEPGATANSKYVRSELRHLSEWRVTDAGERALSGTLTINSHARPDIVTFMQIHGVTPLGASAPPLLRLYRRERAIFAALKRNSAGADTEHIRLADVLQDAVIDCAIAVRDARLTVTLNGASAPALTRDIDYWRNLCYFKAGCYPQATSGEASVIYRALRVST